MSLSNLKTQTSSAALADGQIFKIAIENTGIHRLTFDFLKNELGISNLSNLDPRTIQIYGNKGGALPERIAESRPTELSENAIFVKGEEDGRFDADDFILFYAQAANQWQFDIASNSFIINKNIYDDFNYYFIKINPSTRGKRLTTRASLSNFDYRSQAFDDFFIYELDKTNILHKADGNSGSGQEWFGEHFDTQRALEIPINSFPNLLQTAPVKIEARMALRRLGAPSRFSLSIDGNNFTSENAPGVQNQIDAIHAWTSLCKGSFLPQSNQLSCLVSVNDLATEAWLDYVSLNVRRRYVYEPKDAQMSFRDVNSVAKGATRFELTGNFPDDQLMVWDLTDPANAIQQAYNKTTENLNFSLETNDLKEFIILNSNAATLLKPKPVGAIPNQNLRALGGVNMIIIYHDKFKKAAETLAQHRREHSGLKVATVDIAQVFNEFSSGRQEATALRDFAKMLYDKYNYFKYILLFGDGSFDYKNITQQTENHNYIPVYETPNSLDPINAFPTDDFYALLSDNEGGNLQGGLDIAVGRLPVRTTDEAEAAVAKIIHYDTSPSSFGEWRNRAAFVADDEDFDLHFIQADRIATETQQNQSNLNIEKIYMDAFPQDASASGGSYPVATQTISNAIFKGQLVVNYMGHGGPQGWAQERVLDETTLNSWKNLDRLPLFVTATCTFAPYDNPARLSAGEQLILKEDGGAIALFTTVRPVYASSNERLTRATFERLFQQNADNQSTIGEILRLAKNAHSADTLQPNARKYALLGDPALRLALPKYKVETTRVSLDTLKALSSVTISGVVLDGNNAHIENFNGTIQITVFDKETIASTLANDRTSSKREFSIRKNIIFKGAAKVESGAFQCTFVVPKDINYQYGKGKISYYAYDLQGNDAAGVYDNFFVGGTNPNAINDNEPPVVDVFINDEKFVNGGLTAQNVTLYAKISDNVGMNIAGVGIGHDMTATLDGKSSSVFVLNDFYEGALNDASRGEIRYPLYALATGKHELNVRVWDTSNNTATGSTEFIVADGAKAALAHVLNYPNPFTTKTRFFFEHNLAGVNTEATIQIFTVSGKLVKTIRTEIASEGFRSTDIEWDGSDDFGDRLARGVYIYKISLHATDSIFSSLKVESGFEKLVILR